MCSPPASHKAFTLCALPQEEHPSKARPMKSNSQSNDYTFSRLTCHVCFAPPSHASVYQDVVHVFTSLINFLVRAKKKKKSPTEKASDMRFEKLDQNIFISRAAFLSISPSPASDVVCMEQTEKRSHTHNKSFLDGMKAEISN